MKIHLISTLVCYTMVVHAQFSLSNTSINKAIADSRSVNFVDINNDGWDDIFISNGKRGGQKDFLFINDTKGDFIQQIDNMDLVTQSKPSDGASFADYNQDGYIDAVVANWYGEIDDLFLNDGKGKLQLNANGGVASPTYGETAVFADVTGDGLLDIYITNSAGNKKNILYKNIGNGLFSRLTNHILLTGAKPSRGVIFSDLNNDGHLDVFITNEEGNTNDLFIGKGKGEYDIYTKGTIANSLGNSITASVGDIDNDGDMDIFIGNAGGLENYLYKNINGDFIEVEDIVSNTGNCAFGSAFADYDNDGDLDLYVSSGFCSESMKNRLYSNNGNGIFTDVSELLPRENICSYGCAWGDANNDGFLDIMFANCQNGSADTEHANSLLLNTKNNNNWIKFNLIGVESNTKAIGARIKVKAQLAGKSIWQIRDISAQTGYAGQNSLLAHVGLLDATQVDSVVVIWPTGKKEIHTNLSSNKVHTITEGKTTGNSAVYSAKNLSFAIMPNPTVNDTAINIDIVSNIATDAVVKICSIDGKVIHIENAKILIGKNKLEVDKKMSSGTYTVSLLVGDEVSTQKVIVN
jgi:enediyne biosynthesis protein E4